MKRALFSALTAVVLAGLVGCATQHGRHPLLSSGNTCEGCSQACDATCATDGGAPSEACGNNGCSLRERCAGLFCKERCPKERCAQEQQAAGPATGAVTYPYYTTRGPRDFLMRNPQSIGP
jgi:hypothetical protein